MSRNSVLDGLRSNFFEFIQESMSEKVLESISSEEIEFEGVKEIKVMQPPWILVFPTEFFVKFSMGIVSGSRNPMVIVKIFYLYHVTLKLKVIDLVHGYGATP